VPESCAGPARIFISARGPDQILNPAVGSDAGAIAHGVADKQRGERLTGGTQIMRRITIIAEEVFF